MPQATDQSSNRYKEPSDILKRTFLPPKNPSLCLSSNKQWLIFSGEPPLPSIELLAKPEEKLAGLRFDPRLLAPSRLDYAFDLTAQKLETGESFPIPLPPDSEGIRYIQFNPNPPPNVEQQFVFTSKVQNENKFHVYICNLKHGKWEAPHCILQDRRTNFVNGCAYEFTCNGQSLIVKVEPLNHPKEPPVAPVSVGPAVQVVEKNARKAPGRTYQDLLKNRHDEEKLRHFLTTELVRIDLRSNEYGSSLVSQSNGGKLIYGTKNSPSGRYLLVTLMTDFSYSVPLSKFGKDIQVWDLTNNEVVPVESLPVDDETPLSYDACSRHPRRFRFHPCELQTLLYAHALDGGDPENDPTEEGERDALYTRILMPSDNDGESTKLGDPVKMVGMEWRYDDVDFSEHGIIFVDEYRWKDRMERKWVIAPKRDGQKQMIWERSWEDRYTSPGSPVTRLGKNGQNFVVQPSEGTIFLKGSGASPLGDRPFLDSFDYVSNQKERLWRCKAPKDGEITDATLEVGGKLPLDDEREDLYEFIVTLMDDNDSILISRESKINPRNYFFTSLRNPGKELTVTAFPHPQPDLLGVGKELVKYQRKDGVELTANLFTPANYDGTPRPTLFWAYPREFKNAKSAGQVKGSKHTFVSASWASPVHWAAKGWVVMDNFSLPVVGEGDAQPNDSFVEQIVAGATAAVKYATERGVCDPLRCAVGGHSYGSFMTSHLLSHTSLFAAGIGRSGAFNRTLTPMSFQSEDRSIWEAPNTYINMSPIMHVKKFSEQKQVGKLLLIHGEADENSGTHPLQSERYFAALKAFGIESRLCMLPHERHHYKARESVLHMAWEQEQWLSSLENGHAALDHKVQSAL